MDTALHPLIETQQTLAKLAVIGSPATLTVNALLLADEGGPLPFDDFDDICKRIAAVDDGAEWWVGDLVIYGEEHYGDDFYNRAILNDRYGFDTLQNRKRVALKFPPPRRVYPLKQSFYAEVAGFRNLDEAEQDNALETAYTQKWTIKTLREYLREKTKKHKLPGARQVKVEFTCTEDEAIRMEALLTEIVVATKAESRVVALVTALEGYRDAVTSASVVDGMATGETEEPLSEVQA